MLARIIKRLDNSHQLQNKIITQKIKRLDNWHRQLQNKLSQVNSILRSWILAVRTSSSVRAPDIILCFLACTCCKRSSTVPCSQTMTFPISWYKTRKRKKKDHKTMCKLKPDAEKFFKDTMRHDKRITWDNSRKTWSMWQRCLFQESLG